MNSAWYREDTWCGEMLVGRVDVHVVRMVWTEQNGSHICILVTENMGSGANLSGSVSSLTLAISVTLSQL